MKKRLNPKYVPVAAALLVFVVFYVISGLMFPGFFSPQVFINFFIDNSFLGIASIGMTFVILSGGIDLSVGSMLAFSGVFMATMIQKDHLAPLVVIPMVLACGSFLGFVMGCIIQYFNAPPFIVTLGGMFLARGLSQVISLESIPITNPFFDAFVSEGIPLPGKLIFPWISVIFIAVFIVAFFLLHYTKFGRNVYAIGGNTQSAILMGLPVARTKVLIYTLNGFVSALAGIVYTMYTSAGYSLAGSGFEMDAIASVVIGGTLLTGGVGLVAGTVIGVLIQGIIQTFISFQGTLSSWWTRIVIGFIMFIFIVLQRFLSRLSTPDEQMTAKVVAK